MKKPTKRRAIGQADVSNTRNKMRRNVLLGQYRKLRNNLKREQRAKRKKDREELGDEAPPVKKTLKIEDKREYDETYLEKLEEEDVNEDNLDEFASYYDEKTTPKVIMTTCRRPRKPLFDFMKEVQLMIPNAEYYPRENFEIKDIIKQSADRNYTDLIIFGQRLRKPMHLPKGPTAVFKITRYISNEHIIHHGNATEHSPEVILNNFDTKLGHRIGRMLSSIFPQRPEFEGRRVVTFHNQRDYIFVRHHRYIFTEGGKKANLQELGPRFTMKLLSLQRGTFDSKTGEFEWIYRPEMQVSRKRFYL